MASGKASQQIRVSRVPQRQRGRERVAALMASAAALFVEKGYEAATMTEVAQRAGASIGSLYLFFPTKQALGQAMLVEMADDLSARLERLQARSKHIAPTAIADALFAELALFLCDCPAYVILMDLGGEEWRETLRTKRRAQIAALFAESRPVLPAGQAERLAMIVPQLIRIIVMLRIDSAAAREAMIEELRLMLRHHLQASVTE